jgi:N-acyl-D-aspartate/D-glutamate deacylase
MDDTLLIRGGDVVDGSGAPARRADVRVRDGRIAEVGPDLPGDGERVLDASGAYVTPGLIESHTHYDAAVWWDPDCDPMPAHGCTTLVMANCGLGLAPLRAGDRDTIVDLFSFIEDIPAEAFRLAVPWTWETYAEYRAVAAQHGTAVNTVGFVPHQLLRTWVMGGAAWERAATATELDQLCTVLDDALAAGALGLSTSVMDTDRDNRPVPSRQADDAEFTALVAVLARRRAALQYVPRIRQPERRHDDARRRRAAARRRLPARGERGRRPRRAGRLPRALLGRGRAAVGELQRAPVAREHALRALDHVERRAGVARARQRPSRRPARMARRSHVARPRSP